MKLSEITDKRVDCAIAFGQETLNVVYNPAFLTPAREQQMADETESQQVAELIVGTVLEWDLTDDDGTPIPLTIEAVKDLPVILLGRIFSAIGDHVQQTVRAEGKASAAR